MGKQKNVHPVANRQVEKTEESELYVDVDYDEDDDDDDDEKGVGSTSTETELIDRRDEVGEVRKMSLNDTNRLRLWRIVVMLVILLTAFAVTFTTFTLLERQEHENFKTAVRSCFNTIKALHYHTW
jgi:hypothetical protein